MSLALKHTPATLADLLAIPEAERFHEIIAGELVKKPMPSARHGGAQAGLAARVGGPYGRRPGGRSPGGWRFATETETLFDPENLFRPDVAGWRRARLPELPDEVPVTTLPDWICEVLSPSNPRNDLIKKMRTYHRCSVPHYWLIEPVAETLHVYRWAEPGYLLVVSAEGEERVRAEPFEAVTISMRGLLDGEDDD